MQSSVEHRGLRLLSLDGGGVRGLSSLQIIKRLMERINRDNPPKPCEVFDMIGGTSTGGLIAIMLGRLKMDVNDCIKAYTHLSDRIFKKRKHRLAPNGKIQGRLDSKELELAIKEVIEQQGIGVNELLKDDPSSRCKVFVCAISKEITRLVQLRSYHYSRGDTDLFPITKIWEACRATSAATSFFDPIAIGPHGNTFVDGALSSNNPVRSVFTEAATYWEVEGDFTEHISCIVSVGTGMVATTSLGDRFWEISRSLVKIATESEQTATSFAEEHYRLEDSGCYYRFNVMQGLQGIELENSSAKPRIVAATDAYLQDRHVFKKMKACGEKLAARRSTSPEANCTVNEYGRGLADSRLIDPRNGEQRIEQTRSGLGFEHPEILEVDARVLERQERYEADSRLIDPRNGEQRIEQTKSGLGSEHPGILEVDARVLERQERYDADSRLIDLRNGEQRIEQAKSGLGSEHPEILEVDARVLERQERYDAALKRYDEIFKARKESLGFEHPETLEAACSVARMLERQERHDPALKWYDEIFKARKESLGFEHPEALEVACGVARMLERKKRHDPALKWYDEIFKARKEKLGFEHPETLEVACGVARMLERQERYDVALKRYDEIFMARKESLGLNHPETLEAACSVTRMLERQGRHDAASKRGDEIPKRAWASSILGKLGRVNKSSGKR